MSSPETSFDGSGFVSYVLTNSDLYNTEQLGYPGALQHFYAGLCPQPSALVFFVGPRHSPCAHFYDNMTLNCGNHIQYSNLNISYWQSHFYAYGRPTYN